MSLLLLRATQQMPVTMDLVRGNQVFPVFPATQLRLHSHLAQIQHLSLQNFGDHFGVFEELHLAQAAMVLVLHGAMDRMQVRNLLLWVTWILKTPFSP